MSSHASSGSVFDVMSFRQGALPDQAAEMPVRQLKQPMAADPAYWFRTSGRDLANMLQEVNCLEEAQKLFLGFYQETICTKLGASPHGHPSKSATGWDGSPLEYSFEFKGSTRKPSVRFAVDLTPRRPEDIETPLNVDNVDKVLDAMRHTTPMFDDSWHQALSRWFVFSNASPEKQQALVKKAGQSTSMMIGFDINPKILDLAPGYLPIMGKSYLPLHFMAADKDFTRWQALSLGIRQIPDIGFYPNVLLGLKMLEDYIEANPHLEDGARGISTDLVKAGKARLKIYMQYFGDSFDDIWDYYTLGGRIPIPDLEEDKQLLRDLNDFTRGEGEGVPNGFVDSTDPARRKALQRPTAIYFSLSPDKPYPIPKVYFYPASSAKNDAVIARGLDRWFKKYGWHDSERSTAQRVESVLKLEDNPGMFAFAGIGRKEDHSKGGLSVQVYITPELYVSPRP